MHCDYYKKKRNVLAFKVSKGAKIRNRYNQIPHLTQDTNGKVKIMERNCTHNPEDWNNKSIKTPLGGRECV